MRERAWSGASRRWASPRASPPAGVDTADTHRTRGGCRAPLTRQTGPAPSASRPSTPPTGPASRRQTTRPTPSNASSSRTTERSWRTAALTRTGPAGDVSMALARSWAAGAVLVDGDEPARFDQVTTGCAAIFTGGGPVRLPDHSDGWRWEPRRRSVASHCPATTRAAACLGMPSPASRFGLPPSHPPGRAAPLRWCPCG